MLNRIWGKASDSYLSYLFYSYKNNKVHLIAHESLETKPRDRSCWISGSIINNAVIVNKQIETPGSYCGYAKL